jgi:hypothetical protein
LEEYLSNTIWNEEIRRRYGMADIAEKARETRLRWYGNERRKGMGT